MFCKFRFLKIAEFEENQMRTTNFVQRTLDIRHLVLYRDKPCSKRHFFDLFCVKFKLFERSLIEEICSVIKIDLITRETLYRDNPLQRSSIVAYKSKFSM